MQVDLPKMYDWQAEVFLGLRNHYYDSIHVVKSKRQVGKSILAEIISMYYCLQNQNFKAYIISPSFTQADKIFIEIYQMCKGKQFYAKCNNVKRAIYFKNGSEIRLFSEQQGIATLQGFTCQLLIIDECAYLKEDTIDAVMPYVNTTKGPIIMFSTPRAKAGQFYNYFCMGQSPENNNVYSYDWVKYDTSELLSPAKLELYRKTVDPLKFRTYYLGEFLNNESAFFGDYSSCIRPTKPGFIPGMSQYSKLVFGIDWGSGVGADWTAISIIRQLGDMIELLDVVYFNDKDPNQTINEIEKLAKKWQPNRITVETNSIGNVYFGLLRDKLKGMNIPVAGFTTTNETKDKIISKLQVMMQNNKIDLFADPELLVELSQYEMTFSKTGKRVMNAKAGFHDDLIMSLAIAINSITSGNYAVY